MDDENEDLIPEEVSVTALLDIRIREGVSKDEALMLLDRIMSDIGQGQAHWNEQSDNQFVVLDTEEAEAAESAVAMSKQTKKKHLN